ncbi:hypothetical protein [Vibrio diabolicus]
MIHIDLHSKLLDSTRGFCVESLITSCADEQNAALTELIFSISRYQEEGIQLHPKVYLTNNIDLALKMLPGQDSMHIGSEGDLPNGIKSALKKCAPLANGGWCIYVSQGSETVDYGVFRGDTNPIATSIDETILVNDVPYNTIKVHQVTQDQIEVRFNHGSTLYISLSPSTHDIDSPESHLTALVKNIVSQVPKYKESVEKVLNNVLSDAIKKSHGCLIAVSKIDNIPETFNGDGTCLNSPIDFYELVSLCIKEEREAKVLISSSQMLENMLNTDGIVIFNQKGQLIGFNYFISSSTARSFGGARSRAFSALCKHLNTDLCAVYMQSQDGLIQFKGTSNE